MDDEAKKARARLRKSYLDFKKILGVMNNPLYCQNREEMVLTAVYDLIDGMGGYGSVKQSLYAKESLKLLLEDLEASRLEEPADYGD